MDLLILGGTVFLGRHVARAALALGHRVTLFHRGKHALEPGAFDDVLARGGSLDVVHGDRRRDFSPLADRRWDAVIDTSAYVPSEVARAVEALGSRTGHWTLVSTVSVYADTRAAGMTEDAPLAPLDDAGRREGEQLDREDPAQRPRFYALYGPLKAACERELATRLPGRALIVRPGLIVGPDDPTDRFTYWPERAARGGAMLVPGSPGRPVQFIDVRDLSEWMIAMAERRALGVYHATGPARPLGMGTLIDACIDAGNAGARPVWCDEAWLLEQGVQPWSELPLWIPTSDPDSYGFDRIDCSRAVGAGLAFRPLERTVRDTLDWTRRRAADTPRRAGLEAARERELLERLPAAADHTSKHTSKAAGGAV